MLSPLWFHSDLLYQSSADWLPFTNDLITNDLKWLLMLGRELNLYTFVELRWKDFISFHLLITNSSKILKTTSQKSVLT